MGETLSRTGEWALALQSYRKGLQGWEPLALHNDGTGVTAVAGGIHARIGSVLAKMGRHEEASQEYQRAFEIVEPITVAHPNILEAQYVLADAYSGRAELSREETLNSHEPAQQQVRQWNEARTWYTRSAETWNRIDHPGARTPVGFACGDPKLVEREIKECDAALDRLSHH
jgi:tetratricopeptide (TPR) repeat protein